MQRSDAVDARRIVPWVLLVVAIGALAVGKLWLRGETRAEQPEETSWQQLAAVDLMGDLATYGSAFAQSPALAAWTTEFEKLATEQPGPESALRLAAWRARSGNLEGAREALGAIEMPAGEETLPLVTRAFASDASEAEQMAGLDAASTLEPLWARRAIRMAVPGCDVPREEALVSAEAPARLVRVVVLGVMLSFAGCLALPAFLAAIFVPLLARGRRRTAQAPVEVEEGPADAEVGFGAIDPAAPGEGGTDGRDGPTPPLQVVHSAAPLWGVLDALAAIALFFLLQLLVGLVAFLALPEGAPPVAVAGASFLLGGGAAAWLLRWRAGPGFWRVAGAGGYPWWRSYALAMWGALALPIPIVLAGLLYRAIAQEMPISQNPAIEMIVGASSPWTRLAMFLLVAVAAPLIEETLFRGALFVPLRERLGPGLAVLVSAVLFALAHLDPTALPQYILIGVALGTVRQASGSLRPAMILHGLWNGGSFLMMSLLAS